MPYISSERNASYYEPYAVGPVGQMDMSANAGVTGTVPTTIAESGSWTSNLISADGFRSIAAGVELTQAGTIKIQLYVDQAGNVPQGTAVSTTLTANEANSVSVYDGAPFQSFTVTITNSSGSSATVSDFVLLLNAA
jgi:hypothetical protein